MLGRLLHDLAEGIVELCVVCGEFYHIAVVEIDDLAGIAQNRGDVRGDEILALAETEDQRAVLLDGEHRVGTVGAENAESVAARELLHGAPCGAEQVAFHFIIVFEKIGGDLGIGVRDKGLALREQIFLQKQIVFDDTVVNDADFAV